MSFSTMLGHISQEADGVEKAEGKPRHRTFGVELRLGNSKTAPLNGEELQFREVGLLLDHYHAIMATNRDFNDLIMRIRTSGIALVQAVFGAAAFALTKSSFISIAGIDVHVAAPIIIFGLAMLATLYYVDYGYYYQLLLASVREGMRLDREAEGLSIAGVRPFGLTSRITSGAEGLPTLMPGEGRSRRKVRILYAIPAALGLVFLTVVIFGVRPPMGASPTRPVQPVPQLNVSPAPSGHSQ